MKPQTKLHHEVFGVSKSLTPLTENAKALAIKNVFSKRYGTTSHKTICCLECSHSWKDANSFQNGYRPKTRTCPNCKSNLEILRPTPHYTVCGYFSKIETKGNFQIVRLFYIEKKMRKLESPKYSTHEVIQHFVGINGRVTSMAMPVSGMSMYYDNWSKGSELSIMPNNFLTTNRGRIESDYILPRPTLLKEVTRNGFNGNYHNFAPQNFFSLILRSQQAETLLKIGKIRFLKYFPSKESQIVKYWNAIKICFKNNYEIKNITTWLDYMRLLEEFGKDLSSTKYVCPTDLNKEHDKLVDKKRRLNDLLRAEELKRKIKDQEKAYKKAKKQFFGIQFSNGKITIKVLSSVQEFINEGKALRHCIYTNEYFKEENSLILSARIDDKPIETIELSLTEMKILQARGLQNKATKYNKEIKQLVNANLHQIQQITNLKSA